MPSHTGSMIFPQATAFQFPMGVRSRAAAAGAAPPAAGPGQRPTPFSTRPEIAGSLGMTVAPEGLDSLGKTKDVGAAGDGAAGEEGEAAAADGAETSAGTGGAGDASSSVAAAVESPKPVKKAPKPEVVDVSVCFGVSSSSSFDF